MLTRPYSPSDGPRILELTLSVFGPFYEDSFRPLVGEVVFTIQHGNWREDYEKTVPGLHNPANGRHVDVAEDDGRIAGYVAWRVDPERGHGAIEILAVDPVNRRAGLGRGLCEHALGRMKALGARMVEIGTGGDPFHAPARALYESLGCIQLPVAVYFKEL
ncbi:ribosomal protein S18 acetylase RimI-like enzyme [Sinomonas atrocyanea]|uniref:GNAT family N-acetyltransferase n=1 Tax=Sinomonas atrocyanea TaxID=37927 RepID=UPI002782C9D6|nr:GNAT family N-acetyltransferase [Sinomonas atrocyanea]MDP9886032.1 ribosomal protein S18 acetylase RimI-like enzyme [Sinomonas atrocyanea]